MVKLPKLEPKDIVLVYWLDAHSVDEWTTRAELEEKAEPMECFTVGFYIKTTHHAIVVAATIGAEGDDGVGGTWIIPKGMLKSVKVLKQ